jgi:hypothetical protein
MATVVDDFENRRSATDAFNGRGQGGLRQPLVENEGDYACGIGIDESGHRVIGEPDFDGGCACCESAGGDGHGREGLGAWSELDAAGPNLQVGEWFDDDAGDSDVVEHDRLVALGDLCEAQDGAGARARPSRHARCQGASRTRHASPRHAAQRASWEHDGR